MAKKKNYQRSIMSPEEMIERASSTLVVHFLDKAHLLTRQDRRWLIKRLMVLEVRDDTKERGQ